jgi:hypothetical protein
MLDVMDTFFAWFRRMVFSGTFAAASSSANLASDGVSRSRPFPLGGVSRRAPDAVDVARDVLGAVRLHDPVDGGEVETARGDVRGEQTHVVGAREALEGLHARLLLHSAVQHRHRHARSHAAEHLVHEPDLFAAGQEHQRLTREVALDECPQRFHLLVQLARRDELREFRRRRARRLGVHGEVLRVPQTEPRQVLHRLGLRRAEAQRLAFLRQVL